MKAIILTAEEIKNSNGRNYNPEIWDSKIQKMLNDNTDVIFYLVSKDDTFDYDRYFVEYTLPEGLRLFKSFCYSSAITNGGFYRLDKFNFTEDGKKMSDVMDLVKEGKQDEAMELMDKLEESKYVELSYGKFTDANGNLGVIGNTIEDRNWMTERSKKHGLTFTKGN